MSRRAASHRLAWWASLGLILITLLPLSAEAGAGAGAGTEAGAGAGAEDRDYLPTLRVLFYQATLRESAVHDALSFLKARFPAPEESWPPVARAYLGALEGLQGKYASRLLDKLRNVQRAIGVLRDLPREVPRDPEVLFLRFSLFHQLPPFFGVRSTVGPDLENLIALLELRRYDEVPPDIQRSMAVYLSESGLADRAQAERLRRLLEGYPS